MSEHFEFRCAPCGTAYPLGERSNRNGGAAATVLASRPALEAFSAAVEGPQRLAIESLCGYRDTMLDLAEWFAPEYGDPWVA